MRKFFIVAVGTALAAALPALAKVEPNSLFTDHMVLQRGVALPIWGAADDGEEITVSLAGQTASTKAENGRWMVRLAALPAGGPHVLTIKGSNTVAVNDVLVGEVWLCSGQSNMQWAVKDSSEPKETIAQANHPTLRLFTVPRKATGKPLASADAHWELCTPKTIPEFSAVGYAFGRDLNRELNVPVGLINTSYGGTPAEAWTSAETLAADPNLAYLKTAGNLPPTNPHAASGLYNAMIAPLVPYAVRGAIWYQGESNAGRAAEYGSLFPTMIEDWRKTWKNPDLVFLLVQLAPFMKIEAEPGESAWAELRETQRQTVHKLPKTGMAVITDLGDEKDIHPRQKAPVGARLALAARALAYGESVEFSGPEYSKLAIDGDKGVVSFDHVGGGLVVKGDSLQGFTIAGADKKFYKAEAKVVGDTVVVSSPKVAQPVAVRFGWANYPVVNLWNKAGLPASPFRTDDFPMATAGAKK
jgi:sialate O-acetylesterase